MLLVALFGVIAVALVLLAALVVASRPRDLVNRVLAAYLVLRAAGGVAYSLLHDPLTPTDSAAGLALLHWAELPLIFVLPLLLDALFGEAPRTRTRTALLAASGVLAVVLTGGLLLARGPMYEDAIVLAGVEVMAPARLAFGIFGNALHVVALIVATRVASSPSRSMLQRRQAAVVGVAFGMLVVHAVIANVAYSGWLLRLFEYPARAPSAIAGIAGVFAVVPAWRKLPRAFEGRGPTLTRAALLLATAIAVGEVTANNVFAGIYGPGVVWFYGRALVLLAFPLLLIMGVLRFGIAGVAVDAPVRRFLPRRLASRLFFPESEPVAVAERARIYAAAVRAAAGRGRAPEGLLDTLAPLRRDLGLSERDHAVLAAAVGTAPGGLLLGRFALDRVLGRGATSIVHLAHDRVAQRTVVVKEVQDAGLDAAPFLAEARALARLDHPNVMRLLSAETVEGRLYLVLEHAPGGSLAHRLARGPLAQAEVARLADDLLAGLAAAHALGIVHGDIKAENVLFAADGRALLADFGAASLATDPDATQSAVTFVGSPVSMAPEMFLGDRATVASDLFAVSTVIYRALTGRDHIELRDAPIGELRRRALFAPSDLPHALVPDAVGRVLAGGLAKEPADRPASAAELRTHFAAAFSSAPVSMAFDKV